MRKRNLISLIVVSALSGVAYCQEPAESQTRIDEWEAAIRRASEAGDFTRAQVLHKDVASYCANIRNFPCAERHYQLLLASRPGRRDRVRFFVQLGNVRGAQQDYSGAINAYQDALHDEPKDYEANLALARAYEKVDLSSRAVERYLRCVTLNPRDQRPKIELAALYTKVGYLNKAIEWYKKVIAQSPSPEAYLGLADCYVRQDDIPNAERVLDQGKALLPQAEYDVRLGDIYYREGIGERAASAWEDALKRDPKRDDVRLKLFLLYDRLGEGEKADKLFRTISKLYPESPLVHFLRAWVLYGRGDRQGSRREALTVQQLNPTEVVQHYNERLLSLLNK